MVETLTPLLLAFDYKIEHRECLGNKPRFGDSGVLRSREHSPASSSACLALQTAPEPTQGEWFCLHREPQTLSNGALLCSPLLIHLFLLLACVLLKTNSYCGATGFKHRSLPTGRSDYRVTLKIQRLVFKL